MSDFLEGAQKMFDESRSEKKAKSASWVDVYDQLVPVNTENPADLYRIAAAEKVAELLPERLRQLFSENTSLPTFVELGAGGTSQNVNAFLEFAMKRKKPGEVVEVLLNDLAYKQPVPVAEFFMLMGVLQKFVAPERLPSQIQKTLEIFKSRQQEGQKKLRDFTEPESQQIAAMVAEMQIFLQEQEVNIQFQSGEGQFLHLPFSAETPFVLSFSSLLNYLTEEESKQLIQNMASHSLQMVAFANSMTAGCKDYLDLMTMDGSLNYLTVVDQLKQLGFVAIDTVKTKGTDPGKGNIFVRQDLAESARIIPENHEVKSLNPPS